MLTSAKLDAYPLAIGLGRKPVLHASIKSFRNSLRANGGFSIFSPLVLNR